MKARRAIRSCKGRTVTWDDGTTEEFDEIILCTGYKHTLSFLPEEYHNNQVRNDSIDNHKRHAQGRWLLRMYSASWTCTAVEYTGVGLYYVSCRVVVRFFTCHLTVEFLFSFRQHSLPYTTLKPNAICFSYALLLPYLSPDVNYWWTLYWKISLVLLVGLQTNRRHRYNDKYKRIQPMLVHRSRNLLHTKETSNMFWHVQDG